MTGSKFVPPHAARDDSKILTRGKESAAGLWENGGGLMLKKSASSPVRLAEKAKFAAAASVPNRSPVVVWESEASGAPTILAEVLD